MDHHIIPQFLLRRWAEKDIEKKLHAFLYRRGRLERLRVSPRGTSYGRDLLAFTREHVNGHERQSVETKVLQGLDTAAAAICRKLDRGDLLSPVERVMWARFLISLKTRQPQVVALLRNEAPKVVRKQLAERPEEYAAVAEGGATSLEAWTEDEAPGLIENFGLLMFGSIASHPPLVEKLVGARWALRHLVDPNQALLLGDNPQVHAGDIDQPDFVLALPVSPRSVFLAVNTDNALARILRVPDAELVEKINTESIRLASEKLYADSWAAERFIKDRLGVFGDINAMKFGAPFKKSDA